MSSHWPHWKAQSSLWALPVSNWKGVVYHKIHLVTFLYIFLLVDCFKWALIDCKIHLVTFLYIFLLVDCFKWALIDCKIHLVIFLYIFLLVDCFKELSLTALKSEEFTLCSGSFKCKIHLVTFLYIFLIVDCFKWALIDCKNQPGDISWYLPIIWLFLIGAHWPHWKAKSSLCALAVSNVRFTWWYFFISSY